jgi:phage gp36-like protein
LGYGQIADVKERLHRAETDTTWDDQITRALNQAAALIDLELSPHTTVPLIEAVSNVIVDVANDWAAGLVNQEVINPTSQGDGKENIFITRAKANLARYIEVTFRETDNVVVFEQSVDIDA